MGKDLKVAVISANIGGIDNVLEIPAQTMEYDRIIIDENNLPFPLPNLDNRTKARFIKINPHKFLSGYDIYIWLDGRVQVTSGSFVEMFVRHLEARDFVCTIHYERKNIIQELEFILHEMNKGNHYLIDRYGFQSMRKELEFYLESGYPNGDYPLFCSGMFARWNRANINEACDEWFLKSIEFTNFDQAFMSWIIWRYQLKAKHIPFDNEYFKLNKHISHGNRY